ncbi:hypothetical protein T4D_9860 [Trichinella pseudospiralis]|uniref:Uncharacterized protein n=1 Tax=Trichinella pseudospiralis TaxID=6337 RepID=A0A0V1F610_TRIPS|nr:hypothetical protein T4D_9860 [Trichinella pseudospiralis]
MLVAPDGYWSKQWVLVKMTTCSNTVVQTFSQLRSHFLAWKQNPNTVLWSDASRSNRQIICVAVRSTPCRTLLEIVVAVLSSRFRRNLLFFSVFLQLAATALGPRTAEHTCFNCFCCKGVSMHSDCPCQYTMQSQRLH